MKWLGSLLIICVTSCVSSRYTNSYEDRGFKSTDSFVIAHFAPPGYLSESNFNFANLALKRSRNEVLYYPHYEYDLARVGWQDSVLPSGSLSQVSRTQLHKFLTVDYLITVEVVNVGSTGGFFDYNTPSEVQQPDYNSQLAGGRREASLFFSVFDLKQSLNDMYFITTTQINNFSIRGENGGESTVNLRTKYEAVALAYKKGIKRIAGMITH